MYTEILSGLNEQKLNIWKAFLEKAELIADTNIERTVLVWEGDTLVACGSREENILKCIAVDPLWQGEGLVATVLTALRQDAFSKGYRHLFLYTKPQNETMFSSLLFYPIAQTDKVLLMEDRKNGINDFLDTLTLEKPSGTVGAVVVNCNPFTLGHRYLIETACNECDKLYVFIVSEDKSHFCTSDRLEMVKLGTCDLSNVTVLPTGPYLISSATFPTYFLKEQNKADDIHCLLDIKIFANHFAKKFSISRRFIGSEPLCETTNRYNCLLKEYLPKYNIEVKEIQRLESNNEPISASAVRGLIDKKDIKFLKKLVPDTTFNYLQSIGIL